VELRHLRYFVAVAEEGSVTVAAEKRLHTAQPSLSRQLRDLEQEVGTDLFVRGARGVALTPAGRAFLDHARLALGQAAAAVQAARDAARPARSSFSIGFLTGQEVDWLPLATRVLRTELPALEMKIVSRYSPDLADELERRDLDVAFLRHEPRSDLIFKTIAREPLTVILPSDHRLASREAIDPRDLEDEIYIGFSDVPHVLRGVVNDYLERVGVRLTASHFIDNFAMGISLVASTRGVALLPTYVEPLLPWSVVSRPLLGAPPTIELALGYRSDNASAVLQTFLEGMAQLVAREPLPGGALKA
jgi:LysR family hca operon transcriptional activator